jgi:hypothetical protein
MKKKIALCFSGDLRTIDKTIDNILENLINPLEKEFEVHIFFSTWNIDNKETINNIQSKLTNLIFEEEVKMDNFFITNYSNDNYRKDSLMCPSTPYNASAMWYKVWKSKELYLDYSKQNDIEYSCVFRLRPDIVYNEKIDTSLVHESINNNKIYMSRWHGLYESVTFQLLDHFAFGSLDNMKILQDTYLNIPKFNKDNVVCSAEGYLNEQIKSIELERINFSYSVQRDNKIESII